MKITAVLSALLILIVALWSTEPATSETAQQTARQAPDEEFRCLRNRMKLAKSDANWIDRMIQWQCHNKAI